MAARWCWTCNTEHDPDEACRKFVSKAGGGSDLFDSAEPDRPILSRPIQAAYQSECPICYEEIYPGDLIVSAPEGWAHPECDEETPIDD